MRDLNDVDFVTDAFDCIPGSLADNFLFRHVHPSGPPGKTLMQLIDPSTRLRIDVFRAFGDTMRRTSKLDLPVGPIQLISVEDLTARAARLAFDVVGGVPTASKYARDFLRLTDLVSPSQVEAAWQNQRKATQPATFPRGERTASTFDSQE